jgi:hypothetical protein
METSLEPNPADGENGVTGQVIASGSVTVIPSNVYGQNAVGFINIVCATNIEFTILPYPRSSDFYLTFTVCGLSDIAVTYTTSEGVTSDSVTVNIPYIFIPFTQSQTESLPL